MLFLDFLCLFVCIVLLNARPMFKSMEYEKPFEDKTNTLNQSCFKLNGNKREIKRNVIASPNMFEKKRMKFKRKVTSKELDLKVFDKFETSLDSKNPIVFKTNLENSTNIIPTLWTKIYKLQRLYTPNNCNIKTNTEKNRNIFLNNNDEMEYLGTAEIEAVLNDIKQREIQMIVDQEPSVTNIITNAVTETSFNSMPYAAHSNIFPGYAFSTFLFVSNPSNNLSKSSLKKSKRQTHNKMRSIKENSYTMAYNIEDKLQKKLKKTYCKVKAKLRKDFNQEIKESKATIKETLKKISNNCTSKKVCTLSREKGTKTLRKTKKINKKPCAEVKGTKFSRKPKKSMENFKIDKFSISTCKIPTPKNKFSSLEQSLAKSKYVNNLMHNNNLAKRFSKRNFKVNFIENNNNANSYKDGEGIPDVKYTNNRNKNANNRTVIDEINEKYDRSQVTPDSNYQALSNKISFNDYVNGYKYYLNFQKDNDNEKYSNQVRYQAHKHHNVDDIGKFILKKIPRLPSTRHRRYFVESDTLEDLDISTKSEDSWFKKHFFIYLDTKPPRKYHTSQTVSLKAPDLQVNELSTARTTNVHTHKKITQSETKPIRLIRRHRENDHSYNLKPGYCLHTTIESFLRPMAKPDFDKILSHRKKKKRNNFPNIDNFENKKSIFSQKHSQHKVCKRNSEKDYNEKFKTLSNINHNKNGFVNIDLVHRSTGKIKLKKNNKRKSKLQNFFKKIRINRRKPKIIEKSQNKNHEKRHIFKSFRNIFYEKPKNEIKNEHNVFDYKIVTPNETPEVYNNFDSIKLINVDDIWKQIPTITGDFSYPNHSLQPEIYKNEKLYFSRDPELDSTTKSFSTLSGKGIPLFKENKDDVFAVHIKTHNTNKLKPTLTVHLKAINNPTLVNMLPTDMRNAMDDISNNMKEKTAKVQFVKSKTLHDYDLDNFKQSSGKKIDSLNKYIQDQYGHSIKEIENKKTQPILAQHSKDTLTQRYISGKKILKTIEKNKNQDTNEMTKKSHTMLFPLSVSTLTKGISHSISELFKIRHDKKNFDAKVYGGQTVTPAAKNFKQMAINCDDSFTVKRSKNKGIYNNKNPKSPISALARVNTPPEHYFTTFLPMQINDFHKFLKEKKIDVESVTAPLINSLPRSLNPWTPKESKSTSKRKESMHNSKNYISSKTTCNSQNLGSLLSQHQHFNNKLNFEENMYGIKDHNHNQYGATRSQNYQKSRYDRLKRIKSFTRDYLANILPSQKYIAIINLNNRNSDKDLQSYLFIPDKEKDPLRFSHMTTERYFSKYNIKETPKPEKIHISGHSYKYDVIYHKALSNNDECSSNCGNNADISIISNNNNNDDTYPSIIKKEKVCNINKNARCRSQRGTNELRKKQSVNSKNRHKPLHKSIIRKSKHDKRNAKEESFTAKDVAALEVVVDLLKNTQTYDGNDINAFFDNTNYKSVHPLVSQKERHVTNSIQVHIAIPYNTDDKKRSLDPIRLRKVFSAVMSTPVDLEYQIHSFEETTKAPTSIVQDVLTPGLYLLVENTNITYPEGNFVLKPIKNSSESSKLVVRYVTSTEKQNHSTSSVNVEKLSFNKDFIDAVKKVIQMDGNTQFNKTNSEKKRSVSAENNKIIDYNNCSLEQEKRYINWDVIKKYFSHDKLCKCRCKANQTMCQECVACNAIISELMFELENLANYMTQHCTEIQTYFWMNPSGGRKLRDVIHRIDTTLSDYYKRVKGKCQGRTCQMLSSSIDKRSLNYLCHDNLVNRLSKLADDLENGLKNNIFNDKILISSTQLLNKAKSCMKKRLNKRSGSNIITKQPFDKNIYSLSNIRVNLICNKRNTKPDYLTRNSIYKSDFEKNTHSVLYFDDEEIKYKKKNEKGVKAFLKKLSLKKKSRTKKSDENYNLVRNWRAIDKINYFKHVDNDELNSYNTATGSLSHDIKDFFKLINNVDSLKALTGTKSFIISNQTITTKASRGSGMKNKTAYTLKTKNNLNLNTKDSSENIKSSYKISSAMMPATKSSMNRSNKPTTTYLSTLPKSKFLNRHKLLEFLAKKYQVKNKMNTPDNRNVRSRISKYKKHQPKTRKVQNSFSYNVNDTNITTDVVSSILVIDDDDNRFSDEFSTIRKPLHKSSSKNSSLKCSLPSNLTSTSNSNQDKRVKPGYKGSSENRIKEKKFESINHTFHCGSGTQKTTTFKNTDRHKNILQRLKNVHNDIFNYTDYSYEPKRYKGLLNKIADQFVIKILSDSEFKKEHQKCHHCIDTTTMNQKYEKENFDEKHEQTSSENVKHERMPTSTNTVSTPSTVKITIQEINKKEKTEGRDVQNNIDLKEADDRNKICDITSTISHVAKMHDNLSKNDFEQYVRSISCHKYKNLPNYISIKYKNGNKRRAKYRRRCKTCKKDYKNDVLKWNWIRDKRSLIIDDNMRVELDDYEHSEKCNNTELNMTAHDDQDNNTYKNFITNSLDKKLNKSIEIITFTSTQKFGLNNNKYFDGSLHRVGKRSLLSYSPLNKRDYQFLNIAISNRIENKEQNYEIFFKKKGDIYQERFDRRKRSDFDEISYLRRDLQNLPSLHPLSDEIFVTTGDSVSLSCLQPSEGLDQSISNYVWNTERNEMLDHKNVVVNESQIFLTNVETKNFGTYVCSKNNAVIRSIKVTIISIPRFNIVFTPVYRADSACTYKDLKAVQELNSAISRDFCGKYCLVRIDEPICLQDRKDYLSYIRPIIVISLNSIPNINCSSECKRNLKCSLVRLLLSNIPSLAFVKVLMSFDGMTINKTLTPSIGSKRRSFVTHTLRRKDSNGHYEYHKMAADMEPGNFNLDILCPGGFYLLTEQKICVVCPSNTFSKEGDNVCRICPQGAQAAPGSRTCRLPHRRSRRLAWNANEWSIATVCALVFSALAICYGAIRLLRRACRSPGNNTCNSRGKTRLCRSTCQKTPRRRLQSPSHVILSRLLRGSLTSSRATDSQENRFELWKEKNTLPPLPPIDFDL